MNRRIAKKKYKAAMELMKNQQNRSSDSNKRILRYEH